uniref:Uncharacterized protein n=1 Tax=Poecilia reticulata TaxID=8081 RepID=A0A3P9MUP0_POERE
ETVPVLCGDPPSKAVKRRLISFNFSRSSSLLKTSSTEFVPTPRIKCSLF